MIKNLRTKVINLKQEKDNETSAIRFILQQNDHQVCLNNLNQVVQKIKK